MLDLNVHDVVKAFSDHSDFFIVGRITYLEYEPDSAIPNKYGVAYYNRNDEFVEITANAENVELVNPEYAHRNGYIDVPNSDDLEERFYEKYGDEFEDEFDKE